jgi:hypothetical protein
MRIAAVLTRRVLSTVADHADPGLHCHLQECGHQRPDPRPRDLVEEAKGAGEIEREGHR